MVSLLILLIFLWSFYIGYSRGLTLQLFYSLASLLSLFVAASYYKTLAKLLTLWVPYSSASHNSVNYFFSQEQLFDLDQVFYAGLAFFVLYSLAYILCRILGIFVHLAPLDRLQQPWAKPVAGLLACFVALFVMQMVLSLASTISLPIVQNQLRGNWLLGMIIQFPGGHQIIKHFWVSKIIG